VARTFGVTPRAVSNWVRAERLGGLAALKAKRKGRPRGKALKSWQSAQIAKTVVDHHPDQLKLPFYLWTRGAVARLIQKRFGLKLSVWTVGRYLRDWGFTPQKPASRAMQQNPEAVQHWLSQEYPAIKRQAQAETAQIFWGDEMGLRSHDALDRGRTSQRRRSPQGP